MLTRRPWKRCGWVKRNSQFSKYDCPNKKVLIAQECDAAAIEKAFAPVPKKAQVTYIFCEMKVGMKKYPFSGRDRLCPQRGQLCRLLEVLLTLWNWWRGRQDEEALLLRDADRAPDDAHEWGAAGLQVGLAQATVWEKVRLRSWNERAKRYSISHLFSLDGELVFLHRSDWEALLQHHGSTLGKSSFWKCLFQK